MLATEPDLIREERNSLGMLMLKLKTLRYPISRTLGRSQKKQAKRNL